MQIAIIQFPGSNCERETMLAVKRAGMQPVEFLWNEDKEQLRGMTGYIIVGGFSYEDRSRAGIIAALDPIMREIKQQSEQGKPVLGICNGAQILVETGLVPGLENNKIGLSLTDNKRILGDKILGTGFYNHWVNICLSPEYQRNAYTRHLTRKNILHVPIAHAEGRFIMTDALWKEIEAQGLHVFQYCDNRGKVHADFPVNPNGSMANIAAIANKAGNVMAIMPHPERTKNGDAIFNSMRDYIAEGRVEKTVPLYYYPRRELKTPIYKKSADSIECIIELLITDNHAITVQNALQQIGIGVQVKRQVHWEIQGDHNKIDQIKKSGVLYNDRKEREVTHQTCHPERSEGPPDRCNMRRSLVVKNTPRDEISFLIRPKENLIGQQKSQMLKDHFAIANTDIQHGILWHFYPKDAKIPDLAEQILQTHIIYNPYAHDYYQYD